MGIFKKLKKASKVSDTNVVQKQEVKQEVKEEPFVADISLCEFENANWEEFGGILKQNRILPNSYFKKPVMVDVKLSTKCRPMVLLTFKSETSRSIREYLLLQNKVFQSVNGTVDTRDNEQLMNVWNDFKQKIRYNTKKKTKSEGLKHKKKGFEMMKKAQIMLDYDKLYELEQEFLKRYKNTKFGLFARDYLDFRLYSTEVPVFIPYEKRKNEGYKEVEKVIPFSPRTLEFCIMNLTEEEKVLEGSQIEEFESKCREIQDLSCLTSKEWDSVIRIGKDIVSNQYQEWLFARYDD